MTARLEQLENQLLSRKWADHHSEEKKDAAEDEYQTEEEEEGKAHPAKIILKKGGI